MAGLVMAADQVRDVSAPTRVMISLHRMRENQPREYRAFRELLFTHLQRERAAERERQEALALDARDGLRELSDLQRLRAIA